jgi:hypothetical protein
MAFLAEGGWPIFPVLLLGLTTLILALRGTVAARRDLLPLIIGLGIATLLTGALGVVLGVQRSAAGLHDVPDGQRWIFLLGLKESLQNVVLAFGLVTCASLVAAVGAYRDRARPHDALD